MAAFPRSRQAFFVRWWRQQDEKTKALVKDLVKDGRRAFATRYGKSWEIPLSFNNGCFFIGKYGKHHP